MNRFSLFAALVLAGVPLAASAQPAPAAAPSAAPARPPAWAQYPRMQLERTYGGPLQDTIIQRWRDPVDGSVCYIYLPITAQHSAPLANGYVQYGANTVGSISCVPGQVRPAGR